MLGLGLLEGKPGKISLWFGQGWEKGDNNRPTATLVIFVLFGFKYQTGTT